MLESEAAPAGRVGVAGRVGALTPDVTVEELAGGFEPQPVSVNVNKSASRNPAGKRAEWQKAVRERTRPSM